MSKRTPEKQKEYSAKKAQKLTDSYVANCMKISVTDARVWPGLLELKRATIKLHRAIRAHQKRELTNV